MTMHLESPALTTTNYSRRQKKSKSKKLATATAKHNEWLAKQGLLPSQIKNKKANVGNVDNIVRSRVDSSNLPKLSNQLGNGFKTGIMANLHKEKPEVQREILDKASRCMPLFNKGGIQYATPATDMSTVGSKSRRG